MLGVPADIKKPVLVEALQALKIKRTHKKAFDKKAQELKKKIQQFRLETRKKIFDNSSHTM
jgi:hypothetical protein